MMGKDVSPEGRSGNHVWFNCGISTIVKRGSSEHNGKAIAF
jgi:hypothetical protein